MNMTTAIDANELGGKSQIVNSTLSRQWSSRPLEEKFLSLPELRTSITARNADARTTVISPRQLEVIPHESDMRALQIGNDKTGESFAPTNWAFGQLCSRVGARADYLGTLPSPLASACLNFGLQTRRLQDISTYSRNSEFAAVNGPNFGRVPDEELVDFLISKFGDGRTGQWKMPGEFAGSFEDIEESRQRNQATIFGSDRNVFVFLCDATDKVTVKNRRNGKDGLMSRGVMAWNSEVGCETIGMASMLYDEVCFNRNIWGIEGFREVRIRHTSTAPDRFLEELKPAMEALADSNQFLQIESVIQRAQSTRVDDAAKFLSRQFEPAQVKSMIAAFKADEGADCPIETVWDANTAATSYARGLKWNDTRVDIERRAGKLLDLVAA